MNHFMAHDGRNFIARQFIGFDNSCVYYHFTAWHGPGIDGFRTNDRQFPIKRVRRFCSQL